MMHNHIPSLVIALATLNIVIAVIKFGVWCWRKPDPRSQLWECVAALAAAIAPLVVAIIMFVQHVSVTDQLGHEKLRKGFLCSVVLNYTISDTYQVYLLTSI